MFIPIRKEALQRDSSYSCMLVYSHSRRCVTKGTPVSRRCVGRQLSVQSVDANAKTQELCLSMRRSVSLILVCVPLLEGNLKYTNKQPTQTKHHATTWIKGENSKVCVSQIKRSFQNGLKYITCSIDNCLCCVIPPTPFIPFGCAGAR